jgi:hypothetical protein
VAGRTVATLVVRPASRMEGDLAIPNCPGHGVRIRGQRSSKGFEENLQAIFSQVLVPSASACAEMGAALCGGGRVLLRAGGHVWADTAVRRY